MFSFFFNDTATTEIYPLSLHDALPSCPFLRRDLVGRQSVGSAAARFPLARRSDGPRLPGGPNRCGADRRLRGGNAAGLRDRKSTRLNSSHANISYAVFCLKKKNHNTTT